MAGIFRGMGRQKLVAALNFVGFWVSARAASLDEHTAVLMGVVNYSAFSQ